MCFKETISHLEKDLKLTKTELQRVWKQNRELLGSLAGKSKTNKEDQFSRTARESDMQGVTPELDNKKEGFYKSLNFLGRKNNKVLDMFG